MRSFTSSATLLLGATAIYCSDKVLGSPIGSTSAHLPIFVNDIKQCPVLKAKENAKNIHELRPDDFSVVMALGDSITAGLFARPSKIPDHDRYRNPQNQKPLQYLRDGQVQESGSEMLLPGFEEYRGKSYATGADLGAVTIPNMIQRYRSGAIIGTSHYHHPPPILPSPPQTPTGDHVAANDGLNAALSGSKAVDLPNQVRDYLLPSLKVLDVQDSDWKLLTLSIGANDVCDYCLTGNSSTRLGPGSPEAFVSNIETAVELVRQNIPRTIINVVGLFTVSEIYNLTTKQPPCTPLSLPPIFPRLPLECQCAWAPGPVGDATRQKMDALGEQYAEGLQQMVKRIRKKVTAEGRGESDFGIIWQPGSFLPLGSFPTTTLSPTDCFHPSAQAHERIATGLWNRLALNATQRQVPMAWGDEAGLGRRGEEGRIRCLAEDDRLHFD